jgi:hypothetical protein
MRQVVEQGRKTALWLVPLAAACCAPLIFAPERSARVFAAATQWLGDARVLKLVAVANALTMIP